MSKLSRTFAAAIVTTLLAGTLHAQAPIAMAQREAMQKLAFLIGKWSGPITVTRGPGEPLHLTQTEDVQLKLDGLVLLIEGTSRDDSGKSLFRALATVSYDDAEKKYRFRAYNEGRYLDTELTVPTNGFSWSYDLGPVHVSNSMHRTAKGEWSETTESVYGQQAPRRSMEMVLTKQP
jgi:hypothetical protein